MKANMVKLCEHAETSSGGTPSRGNKAFFGGNIPWLKSGELPDGEITKVEENITDFGLKSSSTNLLPEGTLLIAMYGATVGKLGILTFPAATNQAVCAIKPNDYLLPKFLFYNLLHLRAQLIETSYGGAQPNISQTTIRNLRIHLPELREQKRTISLLDNVFACRAEAFNSSFSQLREFRSLTNSIIRKSISDSVKSTELKLREALDEVKLGIGSTWKNFRVLGATREGLALAKEPPGKKPERYKPVTPGTVFYNPMRIMIGSIAFVDEDDEPGITSPDYVVLKGKEGILDSRWFYYWLRSPLGERCIQSLARGAVRERMLFNRLSEGTIELPEYSEQLRASKALAEIKSMRKAVEAQIRELELVPQKLLSKIFDN